MADFFDLLKKRRSIRDFEAKEVPLDLIIEIIKESCLAPSAENGQPWKFIIVNNKEWIKKLSLRSFLMKAKGIFLLILKKILLSQ